MNKVILMGRLTKDVELKYTSGNNTAVATFTLAVNRKMAKEGQPQADFINCQAWAKTAEFIAKYFAKGQQVAIVGRMQTRTWDDNDGKKHYVTEVVVDENYFADSKKSGNDQHSDGYEPPAQHDFSVPATDDDLEDEKPLPF
jgi:single-strand DNA-binding protein